MSIQAILASSGGSPAGADNSVCQAGDSSPKKLLQRLSSRCAVPMVLLAIGCGCAASGPQYAESMAQASPIDARMARVVFFRTRESALYIARMASIAIDDEKVGATAYGGLYFHDVEQGIHRLRADMWDAPGQCELTLDASAGQIYYFQVDPRDESFGAFAVSGFVADMVSRGALAGIAAGLAGSTTESYGKQCGGAFRLYPVDETTARAKLAGLRLSR